MVVVGGGITGCGVALEAVARGLRTALVEAGDLASGTSSRSSKLVHGGLRYLSQGDFGLVREALGERQRLLVNAPHLVRPLPFLVPLFGRDGVAARSVARGYSSALWLYDASGGVRIGHRHRRVGPADALAHQPSLRIDTLVASFLYWDAQADDARLTLAVARTAALRGAVVVTRAAVTGMVSRPGGRVGGVVLADGTEVRARAVVNAAGVWAGDVGSLPGAGPRDAAGLRPAKGVHLSVPADRLPCDWAAVLSVPGESRTVFVAPWDAQAAGAPGGVGRFTYVGTTDTDYEGDLAEPLCSAADRDGLLDAVNAWTGAGLTPADVTATWAGLRPLVAGEARARSADLSRRHRVEVAPSGLVSVTGGKLTTYRKMASDALDAVAGLLGGAPAGRRSATARLPLAGAAGWERVEPRGPLLADPALHRHLVGRHGTEATAVAALCGEDPGLAEPLVPGLPYLRAEAVWAARREMATTLDDVLSRRTRALLLDREATVSAAPEVAQLLAAELGWDDDRSGRELDALLAAVQRERRALGEVPPPARQPPGRPGRTGAAR